MKTFVMLAAAAAIGVAALQGEPKDCDVVGMTKGQLFSARLTIQAEGKTPEVLVHHPQNDDTPVKIGGLVSGRAYKIRAGHLRFGWPQNGAFVVMQGGKEVSRTEATYEPVALTLQKGQTLRVEFTRSYEPYDGKYFQVKGVWMALVLPRPYWYQDAAPGQFKGPEAYPNSLFFLVDDAWGWGEAKCLDRLAAVAARAIKAGKEQEDFRSETHLSVNVALAPDGKLQKALADLTEADLRAALRDGLEKAWAEMKRSKCYRPFDGQSGAPIAALKKAGYLPKDWANDRTYVSLAEALEFSKPLAKAWREKHPERKPK